MSKVYFHKATMDDAADAAGLLLRTIVEREEIALESEIPLKLHFGEKGNKTYLPESVYSKVIDFLEERHCKCFFYETSVLYGGERFVAEKHRKLAAEHGFTRLPVVIADGEKGEDDVRIPVEGGRHFKHANIARAIAKSKQLVVLSHFKGHMLAGFGGAIKQLSMGCASKGGKMAMHLGIKPRIFWPLCAKCGLCSKRCNEHAIEFSGKRYRINHDKCVGCGACFSICPRHAVSILSLAGLWNALFKGRFFREKLVEYASAAHRNRRNIYLNFALNVTGGCDCEPRKMSIVVDDIGVFASTDPVAIDAACIDAVKRAGHEFRGTEQLAYAEKIELGSASYDLVDIGQENSQPQNF